jgi:opacity protein-like surface antigen
VRYSKLLLAAAAAAITTPAVAAPVAAPTPANGKALILIPLTLTKINDLSFGSVIPSSSSGVVTINATTGARTFAGGVTGVASAAGNRAYFGGAGTPNQQVIMTMNPPAQLTSTTNASDTIDVLALTMDGSAIRTIDPVSHAFFVGIGGTVQIAADPPEGLYQAPFDVTANYL